MLTVLLVGEKARFGLLNFGDPFKMNFIRAKEKKRVGCCEQREAPFPPDPS
jgi:hypothetical protein